MKLGPASPSPAYRLGVALRRLGVVRGIKHMRTEEGIRQEHHGDIGVLNEKMNTRTIEIEQTVLRAEREIGL